MKKPSLKVICKFEFVDGYGHISIELAKNEKNKSFTTEVINLINNSIEGKYRNCHRNKKGYPHQFVFVHKYTDYRIGISNMLSQDYQKLLFEVLHLLADNNFKIIFDYDHYKMFE